MERKSNILIIDDNEDIAEMLRLILEHKGYAPIVVENTAQMNEVLNNNRIDVIIMDMLLSGASGNDICATIKKDNSLSPIPLIMISAHPDAESICKKAGADDFVSKPFDMNELLFKIARFCRN